MTFDPNILIALGAGFVATLVYCLIMETWTWRIGIALTLFGSILAYVGLHGPVRIGS